MLYEFGMVTSCMKIATIDPSAEKKPCPVWLVIVCMRIQIPMLSRQRRCALSACPTGAHMHYPGSSLCTGTRRVLAFTSDASARISGLVIALPTGCKLHCCDLTGLVFRAMSCDCLGSSTTNHSGDRGAYNADQMMRSQNSLSDQTITMASRINIDNNIRVLESRHLEVGSILRKFSSQNLFISLVLVQIFSNLVISNISL